MKKPLRIWPLLLVLAVSFGCSQSREQAGESAAESQEEKSEVEIAIEVLDEAWDATEEPEEHVALAQDFLENFPESEYTGDVLGAVIEPLIDELDLEEEAYTLFDRTMAEVTDPEIKLEAQKQLAVLHSKTGHLDELGALATVMAEEHEFKYTDYLDLMETAVEAEAWELAIQQADASLALATPEAFRAQYDDISDEDVQRWSLRRKAYSAAHKGWAQQNLGQHEAALATFAANADMTTFSLLGVDDTPLHINWGKSLLLQGQPDLAMETLEAEALFGPHEARESYAEAWVASHGSDEGLAEHLWSLREKHAKPLPQFALENYDGQPIDTASFTDQVALIVSWSPT